MIARKYTLQSRIRDTVTQGGGAAPCAEILHWQKMMDAANWDWRGEENRDKIEQRGGNGEPLSAQQSASQPHRSAVFFRFIPCSSVIEEDMGNLPTNLVYRNEKFPLSTDCM